MHTDPIADMLTRIRNASKAKQEDVLIPSSKLKVSICEILKNEGYISGYTIVKHVEDKKPTNFEDIKVTLKYEGTNSVIRGIKRISKPGLRVYSDADKMPKVLNGLGIAIVSTSKGIKTDKACRKERLGGEVLAFVY